MQVHHLKTWPEPFQAVKAGTKKHEFRKADRLFQVGDILILHEYEAETGRYLGDEKVVRVTYIGEGFGIPDGFVCMSIEPLNIPGPLDSHSNPV